MSQFLDQYFDVNFMIDHFDKVLGGFGQTLLLFAIAAVTSLAWGLILALLRQIPGRAALPVRWLTIGYIDAFRGIPLLLIILLISNGLGVLASQGVIPREIGIPTWFGQDYPLWYGVMALTLCYGAYMAEVYRAGIEAIPHGQMEAARSLGMGHGQAMRYVVVPQAVRKVIPPLLNDLVALMKDTALVSVIGFAEVVHVASDIQSHTFNSSAFTLAAIMFLVVTIPLARFVDWLIAREQARTQRSGRGGGGDPQPAAFQPLPSAGGGAAGA